MKPITFHPEAVAEMTDAPEYYESRSAGLGSDLLGEVERALDQVSANPEACQLIGRRARRKTLWRFPTNLVYAVYPDRIRVVALPTKSDAPSTGVNGLRALENKPTTAWRRTQKTAPLTLSVRFSELI